MKRFVASATASSSFRRIYNPAEWSIRICNPQKNGLQILIFHTFGLQIRMDGELRIEKRLAASATASSLPMTEEPLNPLKGTSAYIGKAPFRGLGVDINVISTCLNFLSSLAVMTAASSPIRTTASFSLPLEGPGEASKNNIR
jgi:hypothetical protein